MIFENIVIARLYMKSGNTIRIAAPDINWTWTKATGEITSFKVDRFIEYRGIKKPSHIVPTQIEAIVIEARKKRLKGFS